MHDIKRILVAKLRHHGDVLLTSPLFSLLKKHYPQAQIDAYIYKETLPMLEGHPAIDRFILYDKAWKKLLPLRRGFEEIKILRQIRRAGYDIVLNLTEGDRGALAAKVSKAPVRLGFDPENSGMKGKKKCYTGIVRICHRPRHTVERHLDVLRKLGIYPDESERDLVFDVPQTAQAAVKLKLLQNNLSPKRYVLVHPVSRWLFKCLPVARIIELIQALKERGEEVVLSASPDPIEMQMCQEIIAGLPEGSALNLAGQTSLKELGALIAMSRCLITVDSVPLHISSALKAPVVAIFGPTSEETWAPWRNPQSRVVTKSMACRPCYMPGCGGSGRSDCLESLELQQILKAFDELMEPVQNRV
jgi:heptosyltransferase-3